MEKKWEHECDGWRMEELWLRERMFLLFEKRDGGRDVRWVLLSFWTMMEKREKWMEWCVDSSWRTVRELKRWSSRDVRELPQRDYWEKEIMNENDDCVMNGRKEFNKGWIICWDCQTPQVQERWDCFHWDKKHGKATLKHWHWNNKAWETVERVKQLRREMCYVVFRESSWQTTRNHEGKCEEAGRELR